MSNKEESIIPDKAIKVFQGKIFSVWQWEQELFDGTTATFERIERPDCSYLLPVLPDEKLLLVMDEQPHRAPLLTIPRGRREIGETPEEAARRECLEETGHTVQDLKLWHQHKPEGKISWTISYFIGYGAEKVQEPTLDAGEKTVLHPVTFDEFIELGAAGNLHDSTLQILTLQAKLDPTKMKALKELLYG